MPRESFPLGLSFATLLTTGLGLAAAAWGIQWGAPSSGNTLANAWLYVNVMWMVTWLVIWPALALRPRHSTVAAAIAPAWQWSAILMAALPIELVAAFVAAIPLAASARMLALQSAASLFGLGLIQRYHQFPRATALLAELMTALTLAGPVAAFIYAQFFPTASHPWFIACPLLAVGFAATGPASAPLWIPSALLGFPGLLLLILGSHHEKAPDTAVPGA